MATIQVKCRFCNQPEFVRQHGVGNGRRPRFCCLSCKPTFQLEYCYQACKPDVKERIIDRAMNSLVIRETGDYLISPIIQF